MFLGDPVPREVVWTGEKYLDANSDEGQALAKRGKRPSFRASVNVCVLPERTIKVFEMSANTFKDLFKVREKYGLNAWAYEVERQAKNKYQILPERQLTDEEASEIAALELIDIANVMGTQEEAFGTYDRQVASTESASSSAPVEDASAATDAHDTLKSRLRILPEAAVKRFLDQFGVQRVRDLRAEELGRANAALDQLERATIDPFE